MLRPPSPSGVSRHVYSNCRSPRRECRAAQRTSVSLQPIASLRGLIFDREGRVLVQNVSSFTVEIRPADLPLSRRTEVANRLSSPLDVEPFEIITAIDANPGSRFDLVRVVRDVPGPTADLISESHLDLPGVAVVVEARREYPAGPAPRSAHWLYGPDRNLTTRPS